MNGGSYQGVRILKAATVTDMLRPQLGEIAKGQGSSGITTRSAS